MRSIKGPVLHTPLAVCDARTLVTSDLVRSEVRYLRRTGEIYQAVHSPLHRWSYYSGMDRRVRNSRSPSAVKVMER